MAEHAVVLLDTSVVIWPPSDLPRIADRTVVSTLTIAELASGLTADSDPVERARRHARLDRALTTYRPVAYSSSAARLYGALCEAVRTAGRNPRPRRLDLLIASVAGGLGVPLLTRNPADFRDIHDIVRVIGAADHA